MRNIDQIRRIIEKEFPKWSFPTDQLEQLSRYSELLHQWNQKINLTSIRDPTQILGKHLLDSLAGLEALLQIQQERSEKHAPLRVIDLGSGGGLPSIVLAIVAPEIQFLSVDKVQKKITFQEIVKAQLKLSNFKAIAERLERVAAMEEHQAGYEVVISRAFDQLEGIFTLGKSLLKPGGVLVLWKGEQWQEEWQQVQPALKSSFEIMKETPYQFQDFPYGGRILQFRLVNLVAC